MCPFKLPGFLKKQIKLTSRYLFINGNIKDLPNQRLQQVFVLFVAKA